MIVDKKKMRSDNPNDKKYIDDNLNIIFSEKNINKYENKCYYYINEETYSNADYFDSENNFKKYSYIRRLKENFKNNHFITLFSMDWIS
jgi:hypothetical protein